MCRNELGSSVRSSSGVGIEALRTSHGRRIEQVSIVPSLVGGYDSIGHTESCYKRAFSFLPRSKAEIKLYLQCLREYYL